MNTRQEGEGREGEGRHTEGLRVAGRGEEECCEEQGYHWEVVGSIGMPGVGRRGKGRVECTARVAAGNTGCVGGRLVAVAAAEVDKRMR